MGVTYTDHSPEYLRKLTAAIDGPGGGLDLVTFKLQQRMATSMPGAGAAVLPGTGGDTGKRAKYVPSSPGQPPGVRTGRLRSSMANARVGSLRWAAGTNASYARHLEYGTKDIQARPFMRPALRAYAPQMGKDFAKRVRERMGVAS